MNTVRCYAIGLCISVSKMLYGRNLIARGVFWQKKKHVSFKKRADTTSARSPYGSLVFDEWNVR